MSAAEATTGMLVVITDHEGVVQAAEADFQPGYPAGYTRAEMQQKRAEDAAWAEVLAVFCGRGIDQAIRRSHSAFGEVKHHLKNNGWKVTVRPVNLSEEDPAA